MSTSKVFPTFLLRLDARKPSTGSPQALLFSICKRNSPLCARILKREKNGIIWWTNGSTLFKHTPRREAEKKLLLLYIFFLSICFFLRIFFFSSLLRTMSHRIAFFCPFEALKSFTTMQQVCTYIEKKEGIRDPHFPACFYLSVCGFCSGVGRAKKENLGFSLLRYQLDPD